MKYYLSLVCLLISFAGFSQNDTTSYKIFPAIELQQDFDSMYLQLQLNHPNLYANRDKTVADKEFQQIRHQLNKPMNRLEFTRLVSPFVAGFSDGHTFMDVDFDNEDLRQYTDGGGKFFPLGVAIINDKIFCTSNTFSKGTIQPGDEILSINNMPVGVIIQKLIGLWSADGPENATATAQRLFSYSLWIGLGWGNKTEVVFKHTNQSVSEFIEGISKEDFTALTFNTGTAARQLHIFHEHSLAVVEINSYNNVEKSKSFIDSCFAIIKQKGLKNIALDLRKNGGGNSYIGDYFLAHITRKKYNTVSSKRWRIGPLVQSLSENHWMKKLIAKAKEQYTQEGEYFQSAVFQPQSPASINDSTLYADANFFLLTSARTYSSAHMTALAVKCGGLGTIIGQPTGERLDLTGEILVYNLPHSKLGIVIPTASYKTACGNGQQVGVQPDHFVPLTVESIQNGKDAELEMLLKLISKQ